MATACESRPWGVTSRQALPARNVFRSRSATRCERGLQPINRIDGLVCGRESAMLVSGVAHSLTAHLTAFDGVALWPARIGFLQKRAPWFEPWNPVTVRPGRYSDAFIRCPIRSRSNG